MGYFVIVGCYILGIHHILTYYLVSSESRAYELCQY